jgi:hypothetical protein
MSSAIRVHADCFCQYILDVFRYLKCVRTTATDGFPGVFSYAQHHGFSSYQQEYEVRVVLAPYIHHSNKSTHG